MLAEALSRYVYSKSLAALRGMGGAAQPPSRPAGGKPLLLYLHVPFCEELCGYCTFNRERFEPDLARRYFESLRQEIAMYHRRGYAFDSLYIGGGTPTVLPEELVRTIGLVRSLWNPVVISVETHPDHLTEKVCRLLEDAGVNRLSVGVQSFQGPVLRSLDRKGHIIPPEETRARLRGSIERFRTVNIDLIFNVPGETTEALQEDVEAIMDLLPHQATFYPLMRPRCPEGRPEVTPRRLYTLIVDGLSGGYRQASGWSFSRIDAGALDEYITERESYAGLGSGSFGYIDGIFYANTFSIPRYLRAIADGELPLIMSRRFSGGERARYYSLMNLFNGRLDPRDALRTFGLRPLLQQWKGVLMMAAAGGIRPSGRFLGLTAKGRYFSMLMMKEFFSAVSELRERCREASLQSALLSHRS